MITSYEIEFLPVGNGEKSGDCILFHYVEDNVEKIIAYDGGTQTSGKAMVEHIKKYYGMDKIDYLINSHPDGDHVSGLTYVLENMKVGEVWIHQPWKYSAEILDLFHDGRMTANSLSERMKTKLRLAHRVYELAIQQSIPVYEPYAGAQIGPFTVLSPDEDWYKNTLVPDFSKTPPKAKMVFENIMDGLENLVETVAKLLEESWTDENLPNNVQTSAENNSSVVLYANLLGRGFVLTGDSGVEAIDRACIFAEQDNLRLKEDLKFVQVPHHGSRRNVSTTVLNRLLGEPINFDAHNLILNKTAFVSASQSSKKHPRDRVVNAFMRRGFKVIATKGSTKRHYNGMPERAGWGSVTPLEFSYEVDDTDN
nr:MBL fold metallo-hydrolase [uncultured Acinetobacter sp.]